MPGNSKERNVVLHFKMDGQVQYANTLKQINMVMNNAAKEYKNHIAAMGQDATMTDKLLAEKKKLEIQMEAAQNVQLCCVLNIKPCPRTQVQPPNSSIKCTVNC